MALCNSSFQLIAEARVQVEVALVSFTFLYPETSVVSDILVVPHLPTNLTHLTLSNLLYIGCNNVYILANNNCYPRSFTTSNIPLGLYLDLSLQLYLISLHTRVSVHSMSVSLLHVGYFYKVPSTCTLSKPES